jgi:hypothetical protein
MGAAACRLSMARAIMLQRRIEIALQRRRCGYTWRDVSANISIIPVKNRSEK